jgi:hypothetical protein
MIMGRRNLGAGSVPDRMVMAVRRKGGGDSECLHLLPNLWFFL